MVECILTVLQLYFEAVFDVASDYQHMFYRPSLLVSAQIWC